MSAAIMNDPLLFNSYNNYYYNNNNNNNIDTDINNNTNYNNNIMMNNNNNSNNVYETESYNNYNEVSSTYSSSPDSNLPLSPVISTDIKPSMDADWNMIMSKIKHTMYNSTSVMIPSPVSYLCENTSFKPKPSKDPHFFYNNGILDVKDMFSYRQLRSESLLYRLFNCPLMKTETDPSNVMRLSKGVFIAQQTQPSSLPSPQISPLMASVNIFDDLFLFNEQAPIGTFDYGNMKQLMMIQQQQKQHEEGFVPFSYTIGGRYTNPYNGRDVLLRGGQLPMWCQTLFLNECMSRMPLEPHVPYTGLFPFAPSIVITFKPLSSSMQQKYDCYPELTLIYEKYAMELSEPDHIMDMEGTTNLWKDQKQQILDKMLYCDIPEETVPILTQLATIWAADQGFLF